MCVCVCACAGTDQELHDDVVKGCGLSPWELYHAQGADLTSHNNNNNKAEQVVTQFRIGFLFIP